MKPETKLGRQLQTFNRIAGITHLIQGVVLFLILNPETTIPVITRFFDETTDGVRPVSETLFEFPIALIAPIFLLLQQDAFGGCTGLANLRWRLDARWRLICRSN
jgi:hypothetical protein